MQNIETSSAIPSQEQRSKRFRYRHSVVGAAGHLDIPATWVWSWLLARLLTSRTWLRRVWVRLEDVQKLSSDRKALQAAFYATGEPLTSPRAIQRVLTLWPKFPNEMYTVQKKPVASVTEVSSEKEVV